MLEVPNRPAAGREEVREVEQHSHETYGSQMNCGNFCSLVLIEAQKPCAADDSTCYSQQPLLNFIA